MASKAKPARAGSREKVGVVVVHGIGDPNPGDTLYNLTEGLAHHENPLVADLTSSELHYLVHARRKATRLIDFFPMMTRRANSTRGNEQLVFAEVYWSDVSRLAKGWYGIVQGITKLFFSIRYLIDGATPSSAAPTLAKPVHSMAALLSRLITGPVLAANMLLLMLSATYWGLYTWGHDPASLTSIAQATFIAAMVTVVIAFIIGSLLVNWQHLSYSLLAVTFVWVAVFGSGHGSTWEEVFAVLVGLLQLLLVLGAVLLIVMVALHWIVPLFGSPEAPLTGAVVAATLQYGLWVLLVPLGWWQLVGSIKDRVNWSEELFAVVSAGDEVRWVAVALILLAIFIAIGCRQVWTWRHKNIGARVSTKAVVPRRLILNNTLAHFLLIVSAAAAAVAVLVNVTQLGTGTVWPFNVGIGPWLTDSDSWRGLESLARKSAQWLESWDISEAALAFLTLAVTLLSGTIRAGLDLAGDVITYVYWNTEVERRTGNRQRGSIEPPQRPPDKKIGGERPSILARYRRLRDYLTAEAKEPEDTRPIRRRFKRVVDTLITEEKIDRLVVIAHSQGSVIAIDELNHSWQWTDANKKATKKNDPFSNLPVTLVTMGSPYFHLYQHYFPAAYPPWDRTKSWRALFDRVDRWLHLHRHDDFVGLTMGLVDKVSSNAFVGPDPRPISLNLEFKTVPVGVGGHVNYWRDLHVLEEMHRFDLFKKPPRQPPTTKLWTW